MEVVLLCAARFKVWSGSLVSNAIILPANSSKINGLDVYRTAEKLPIKSVMRKNLNFFFIINAIGLLLASIAAAYLGFYQSDLQILSEFNLACLLTAYIFIVAIVYFAFFISFNNKMIESQVTQKLKETDLIRLKMVETARMAALGAMASGVAHEINNPLAIMMGHIEHIRRFLFKNKIGDEKIQKYFKVIESSSERISKITKSLRFIAHEGEKEEFQMISIRSLVSKVLDLTLNRTTQLGIDFEVLYQEDEDLLFECRESQIGHVLLNMINNSIDAIQDMGSDKWIHIFIGKGGFNEMSIRIVDTGYGIPPETRDKIFEPFFTTRDVNEGAGLGLSIALGIIKDHQGSITYVINQPHTTFDIMIPLQQRTIEEDVAA
jgi:signal transduction histidine kinase